MMVRYVDNDKSTYTRIINIVRTLLIASICLASPIIAGKVVKGLPILMEDTHLARPSRPLLIVIGGVFSGFYTALNFVNNYNNDIGLLLSLAEFCMAYIWLLDVTSAFVIIGWAVAQLGKMQDKLSAYLTVNEIETFLNTYKELKNTLSPMLFVFFSAKTIIAVFNTYDATIVISSSSDVIRILNSCALLISGYADLIFLALVADDCHTHLQLAIQKAW